MNWYEIETWYRFPCTTTKTTSNYTIYTALILYLNSLASCYCSYNLVRTTLEHLKLLTYKKELSIPHSLYAYCNTTYSGDGDFYILHTFRKSHFRKSIVMVPSIVKHLAMNKINSASVFALSSSGITRTHCTSNPSLENVTIYVPIS